MKFEINAEINPLFIVLYRLSVLQREIMEKQVLNDAVNKVSSSKQELKQQLEEISKILEFDKIKFLDKIDPLLMPILAYNDELGWFIVKGINPVGKFIAERVEPTERKMTEISVDDNQLKKALLCHIRFKKGTPLYKSQVLQLVLKEIFSNKMALVETAIGGLIIGFVTLGVSLFALQVYDRVIPNNAFQTLTVLTTGVVLALFFEHLIRRARSKIYENLINKCDKSLSRSIIQKFLSIKLEKLPKSVGSFASQLRGYETIRAFLFTITSTLFVDMPLVLLYVFIIFLIGGIIAIIPLVFLILALVIGYHYKRKLEILAKESVSLSNSKAGVLVETIQGVETIKTLQANWQIMTKWSNITDTAREYELKMRRITEKSQHRSALFQQLSYVSVVATGAILASKGELTLGGIIACSILSSRTLAPIAVVPNILIQSAHTKAAIKELDAIWQLEEDDELNEKPIIVEKIHGNYLFENVSFRYSESNVLQIPSLRISAGEKIGVLGPVGSGKTTLLRLLTGFYTPTEGRIFIDNIDISKISKTVLSETIGYLPQDVKLFAGTLRENLIIGMVDPGDEKILEVARLTGLLDLVIKPHPKGLERKIYEGGVGLSEGQKQLVNLTRLMLREPKIWLLDEPTSTLDKNLEILIINILKQKLTKDNTLVVVTHKPDVLVLVDRIIVIVGGKIVMDGPKDEILRKLTSKAQKV